MDTNLIALMLSKVQSNIGSTDVLEAQKFLSEKGYELERMLGCGSSGAVMLAQNIKNRSKVAIKMVLIENNNQSLSFTEEFFNLKKLKSPYIASLLDSLSDPENRYLFFVMNYEENGNLEEFLSNHPVLNDS